MQAAQECDLRMAWSSYQLERSAAEEVEAALHGLVEETEIEEPAVGSSETDARSERVSANNSDGVWQWIDRHRLLLSDSSGSVWLRLQVVCVICSSGWQHRSHLLRIVSVSVATG